MTTPHKKFSFKFFFLLDFFIFLLFLPIIINIYIVSSTEDNVFDIDTIPEADTAIILGASVNRDGSLSDVFKDRALTGIELYNKGKIKNILVSGDNGTNQYNEVEPAKNFLKENGIPEEFIYLDYAGFDTYDTMYRANYIFSIKNAIVVTQEFHLARSLYLCGSMKIDCLGIKADKQTYVNTSYYKKREYLARVKAFIEVLLNTKPKYLGPKVDMSKPQEI